MDELTIGDKIYISSKRAAAITGYAKDYVGQLCREGRVEATLAGRSWYVLETSIRAHRFGGSSDTTGTPVVEPASEALKTWESPKYEAESTPQMPSVTRRTVNLLEDDSVEPKSEPVATSPETIEDMQSAWREWFASRQAAESIEDTDLSATEPDEEDEDLSEEEDEQVEEVEIEPSAEVYDPIPSTPEIEEPVQLRRNYEYTQPERPMVQPDRTRQSSAPAAVVLPVSKQVLMRRSRMNRKGSGSPAIKAALISVAVFAAIVTAIGAGATDAYIQKEGVEYSMLRFFAGASLLKK